MNGDGHDQGLIGGAGPLCERLPLDGAPGRAEVQWRAQSDQTSRVLERGTQSGLPFLARLDPFEAHMVSTARQIRLIEENRQRSSIGAEGADVVRDEFAKVRQKLLDEPAVPDVIALVADEDIVLISHLSSWRWLWIPTL